VRPEREIGGIKITKARQGLGLHGGSIKRSAGSGKKKREQEDNDVSGKALSLGK
jgi:hypothetical protein